MAERTIDIIYRFIADTKQFEDRIKHTKDTADLSDVKLPSYKELEKHLRGVEAEVERLRKLNRITADEAANIKKEYLAAAGAVDKLNATLSRRRANLARAEALGAARSAATAGMSPEQIDPLRADYVRRTTGGRSTKEEALIAYQRGSASIQEMAQLFNSGTGIVKKMGDQIKITRVELKRFNVEAQRDGKKTRATLEEIGRAVMVKGFSFYGLRMTGASIGQQGQLAAMIGGGISGGMFKMASEYIKNLSSANETSREWAKQMNSIEQSQRRIGAVMASESLPLLQKGADLLTRVANFVEKNPEAVGKLMNAGLTLAGVGALVIALGKGITLVSDIAFIAATINMLKGGRDAIIAAGSFMASSRNNVQAGTMMLAASKGMGKLTIGKFAPLNPLVPNRGAAPILTGGGTAATTAAAGGAGLVAALQAVAAALAGFAAGAWIGDKLFDAIEGRDQKFADYTMTIKQGLAVMAKDIGDTIGGGRAGLLGGTVNKILGIPDDLGDQWFRKVRDALMDVEDESKGASDGLEGLSDALRNSLKRDEILAAWEDYIADDLALVRKHGEDRKKLEQDAIDSIRKANQKFANDMRKIASKMNEELAKAAADFNQQEEGDLRQYNERRAEIIREGQEREQEQLADLQEKLRKLWEDFQERQSEALAARDAVALVKNRKKLIKDQDEAMREYDRERAQRREEQTRRLQELQVQHEQERAQRLVEYQARIAEIQENARQEQEELRRQHAEELREIQLNRNNRLRELDLQLQEERNRRRDAFLAQVRDLDATLLGEENLRKEYHARMLRDLDAFLSVYRTKQGTMLSVAGSRQAGGYVASGLYKLHSGEYVVNPNTAKTLESLMGGQLTQAGLVQMAHNSRTSVTWNDQRRFDSSMRPAERRMIRNDTLEILEKVAVR